MAVGTKSLGESVELVVESDVLPDLQRVAQRCAGLGCLAVPDLVHVVAAFVAREDHRFQGHAVGGRAGLDTLRMTNGATAKLQHDILAKMIKQLVHLAGMDATGRHRHHLVHARPILVEEHAMFERHRIEILTAMS